MFYFDRVRKEAVVAQTALPAPANGRYVRMPRITEETARAWIAEFDREISRDGIPLSARGFKCLDAFAASLSDRPRILERWLDFKAEKIFCEMTHWLDRVRDGTCESAQA